MPGPLSVDTQYGMEKAKQNLAAVAAGNNPQEGYTVDSLGNRIRNTSGLTPEQQAQRDAILNQGTTHETTAGYQWDHPGLTDPRSFMYGRDPGAADAAVNKAYGVGDQAFNVGGAMLNTGVTLASQARDRMAPTGDFTQQNSTLNQLTGLEAQQGQSGAQAQLQQGTNMGMAQQLALARSGRGFGGNAAAMGQAQSNMAGISANQANQAAMLSAQENDAWRGRQASNLATAGGMFGQQANANLNAGLQSTAQNDQASLGYLGFGGNMYGAGANTSLQGMGVANNIRGQEMAGGSDEQHMQFQDWLARNGFSRQDDQADANRQAAVLSGLATAGGMVVGGIAGGPGGAAAGGAVANAGANAALKK